MTYWSPGVFEVIELVNTIFPAVPVVLIDVVIVLRIFSSQSLDSGTRKKLWTR